MTAFADPATDTRLTPPADVMRGPTHADNYRIKVGRFSDRWYTDPLPADDTFPATPDDEAYPSVSIVKKASGNDWTYVGLKRVAYADDLDLIAAKGYFERYEKLKVINSLGLSAASRRGNNVHTWAECLAYGIPPTLTAADEGHEFFGTVDRIWSDLQPELFAAELPCFHRSLNGVGYGGTADGIFRINGKLWLVDWKSRGDDSDHAAYPEEAAQAGAYSHAEYIILDDPDPANPHGAKRAAMPELDGGLIISIKSDSYEVYPIDLCKAMDHFAALHAWWVARRTERESVGRKWPPRRTATAAANYPAQQSEDLMVQLEASVEQINRKTALYARHDKMTAEQQGDFLARVDTIDTDDLDAIEQLMNDIEHPPTLIETVRKRMADDRQRDTDRYLSVEGGPPADEAVHEFHVRWELAMDDDGRAWVGMVVNQAIEATCDFRLSTRSTQRRADTYCALTEWTTINGFDRDVERDNELFRAVIFSITNQPDTELDTLGSLVGALSASQAAHLRGLVSQIASGEARFLPGDATSASRWVPLQDITSES